MPTTKTKHPGARKHRKPPPPPRRTYNSPLRKQQAEHTRAQILDAGTQIARTLPTWDWDGMTFKSVGDRAKMSERTVRRHFATERALRNAIQQRLLQECGVDFATVEIPVFAEAAERVHRYMAGFASSPQRSMDPGLTEMDSERRTSLLKAVARATPAWTPADRAIAAATLDLFWNPVNFERFGSAWRLDPDSVTKLIRWVVSLLQGAMREGRRP
jgi:AcrR family transcriptional regulator